MPFHSNRGELVQAIYSIPAYISRCAFFFALCPVIDSATQSKVFTPFSWSDRGWCRFERACRELSENASWILIRSRTELELIASPFASIGGSAGEGAFTLAEDKLQLAEVLRQALQRKLHLLLQKEDLEGYRVLLNLQHVHLRGFSVQPWRDLVPGFEDFGEKDPSSLRVSRFLHENGFSSVRDVDSRGWSPLHYAALAGDALVVESLLEQRADLHRVTQKDQSTGWSSTLGLGPCNLCHVQTQQGYSAARRCEGSARLWHPTAPSLGSRGEQRGGHPHSLWGWLQGPLQGPCRVFVQT